MYGCSRQQRHDLGRCDGSEDIKPMEQFIGDNNMVDVEDYSCSGVGVFDPSFHAHAQHKHYVMPDYTGKDYVLGATADVIRLNTTSTTTGYDEYPTETRPDRQQQQQGVPRVSVPTPRIHYHVYESPQMTS